TNGTVASLVALAAAAGARVVAADDRTARQGRLGAREQRLRFGIIGRRGEAPARQRHRGARLTERDAIAYELAELERARDRIGDLRRERGELRLGHDAAEV